MNRFVLKAFNVLTIFTMVFASNAALAVSENSQIQGEGGGTVWVCHATASENNPYNAIEVDENGWNGHSGHEGDFLITDLDNDQEITDADCDLYNQNGDNEEDQITIVAEKIICEEESMLPNWGAGGPDVNENTASEWVAEHDGCFMAKGWNFEWAYYNTGNPGDNLVGETGGAWTSFNTTTVVPMPQGTDDDTKLWVREVMEEGYIPFTFNTNGQTNADDVSAEIYCHTDVLNYDNYERLDGIEAGGTYHCVAWNVAIPDDEPEEPSCDAEEVWARVVVTEFSNEENGNLTDTIYLGSSSKTVASGEWFKVSDLDANDIETFADVPGLAVQRKAGEMVLELHGSQGMDDLESVEGYIEFFNGTPVSVVGAGGQDKLETTGHFDSAVITGDKVQFDLAVNTADDRFSTMYDYTVDESCYEAPSCNAPAIWARVVITEFSNEGNGNLTDTIYLGSSSNTVANGAWFPLSVVDTLSIEDFADVPGIAVKRRADSKIVLELHGSQELEDRESVQGYIEFFNGTPTLQTGGIGQDELEDGSHGREDLVWIVDDKSYFDLVVNTADDRFSTTYEYGVDEDCGDTEEPENPQCEINCEEGDDQDEPSCEDTNSCEEECSENCTEDTDEEEDVIVTEPENSSGGSSSGSRSSARGSVAGASTAGDVLGACTPFTEYHKKGDVGGEIPRLQEFLNQEMGLTLEVNGTFDEATFQAVKAFQQKYFDQIIRPWGFFPARVTGYVYKSTISAINDIIECPQPAVWLEDPKIMWKAAIKSI